MQTLELGTEIETKLIRPSPLNPRKELGDLRELTSSIKTFGVISPVLVRPSEKLFFELVVGHRRLAAAKEAGLTAIPATIAKLNDSEVLAAQLAENLAREDLSPLDVAEGLRDLHLKHKLSLDDIAAQISKSKATVHAYLKLCTITETAQQIIREKRLSYSKAVLISGIETAEDQERIAKAISEGKDGHTLSYREARELVDFEARNSKLGARIKSEADKFPDPAVRATRSEPSQTSESGPGGQVEQGSAEQSERVKQVDEEVADRALASLMETLEAKDLDRKAWALLVGLLVEHVGDEGVRERRGIEAPLSEKWIGKARPEQLRAVAFELLLQDELPEDLMFRAVCDYFGVDLKRLELDIRAEREEAAKKGAAEQLFRKKGAS